ncbi:hypothetical protein RAS12_02945 [Achromobacter seleniivolatilans]|uniref:Uncharacterized protein n=1 Tax=Achromobacter seleniivolatilans TaxID=3047478 RepID=A0ABY9M3J3_9BURK|nr:hypothetical protein [Achromobacter sp. R39]WMD21340.1 hypothetical protein RAS12_02945 [Achromobacter sp. R39]
MAIDSEPKDGDFARYIENLTRAGGTTPGRVPDKREASRQAASPIAAPASRPVPATTADSLSTAPWGKPALPPLQSRASTNPPGSTAPQQSDEGTVSMARRARQRKIGIILTIAGMLAGWAAVNIGFRALRNPHFDLDQLVPAIFLGFFAFMLFKAASGVRNPRKTLQDKLPPLKQSSYRKDGG